MIAIENIYLIAGNARDVVANIDMGAPDFTGFQIKWYLKPFIGEDPVLTKDSTNGATSAGKQITIRLKTADTKTLAPGTYWHELKIVDQNNEETTLVCGDFVLYAS
jgi:hypothetical protein